MIFFCHNVISDKLVKNLAGKAFTTSAVHNEHLIKPRHLNESEKKTPTKDTSSQEKI